MDDKYIGSGKIIKNAISKYGRASFTKEILEICETVEIQNLREEFWIQSFDARNPDVGYNIDTGGYLGPRSDIAKANISDANKSENKRKKISHTLMNHAVSDDAKQKMRRATLESMTPERKLFQRENMLGRKKMKDPTGKCTHVRKNDIQTYIDNGWELCVS